MRFRALSLIPFLFLTAPMFGQTQLLSILLPEKTRLLEDQRVDLVIEMRNVTSPTGLRVTANGRDITSRFGSPTTVDLDCNARPDSVVRANLQGFSEIGYTRIEASVNSGSTRLSDVKDILVYEFKPGQQRKNVVLFIGDAMGQTYRDAARLVARSVETVQGVSGMREGFFDNLLEMDKMPVNGTVMTYSSDNVVPDSANTASAWSTGNKTYNNGLGVFGDGTDCRWRQSGVNMANIDSLTDNPRIETLWEYLKRKYNYRTGIVTTSDVTDATPAGEAGHVAQRGTRSEISKQFIENPFLNNQPAFDVILGGGNNQFEAAYRLDKRDLIGEFRSKGFAYVTDAKGLRGVNASSGKLLGLFRSGNNPSLNSSGVTSSPDGNMDVAYDKLRLVRPGSEPEVNFGGFTDQPMLELMTEKAIQVLAGPVGDQPFILMVEAASIDKQSHPNNAAGTIWDSIEMDKSVGVARRFLAGRRNFDTLVVVSADHDQSMHILGVTEMTDEQLSDRTGSVITIPAGVGTQTMRVFNDSNANVRAAYNFVNGSDPGNSTGPGGPPSPRRFSGAGFPNYMDEDGDGYPENKVVRGKGNIRLVVGYRTGDHTGSSVPVSAEGPGALLFTGVMDQTDLMFKMATIIGTDTKAMDEMVKVLNSDKFPQPFGKQ